MEKYFEFGLLFQEMWFNVISILALGAFCSAEQNCLCNFGRGQYEEYFCENILNLGQWFKKRCLKIFLF